MMFRAALACLLTLLGLTFSAQAQTYTIRIKEFPDPGKKLTATSIEKSTGAEKVSVNGKTLKDEMITASSDRVFTFETIEKGDGPRPAKFQKKFTKAVSVKDQKEVTEAYQGLTITYALKGDSYEVKAAAASLPAEDLKKLQEQANQSGKLTRFMLPAKAVDIDVPWSIDPARLVNAADKALVLDLAKSMAKGKLVKVYQKNEHQFGTLEFELKMAVTGFGNFKLDAPIWLTSKITLDAAIDGSTTEATMTSSGTIQGKAESKQGNMTLLFDIDVQRSSQASQSAEN